MCWDGERGVFFFIGSWMPGHPCFQAVWPWSEQFHFPSRRPVLTGERCWGVGGLVAAVGFRRLHVLPPETFIFGDPSALTPL